MGNKLHPQPEWRLITDSASTAARFGRTFGGEPESHLADGAEQWEVLSERSTLPIVVDGPELVFMEMKLWDSRGLAHHCDGDVFLASTDRAGTPCGCPPLMTQRKERARFGQGPQPITTVLFRLADDPEMGVFRFRSSSWRFAETVEPFRADLATGHGSSLCELSLECVVFTTGNGRQVSYYKPAAKVRGPWSLGLAA
ncbi:hypothetical protein [Streptomyces sp. NPDC051561]|uniref:recombination directionality factor n=1 Tax=Streptomyces sp. NPDC051561 TaxID=3365658 RepID=UPI0037AA7855